ncbi:alpha-(1,3)-fucosyltransferase C-like [Mizuhopecten yessoensis]|uniref:Fucosyltransferase n=1 Tax=Mizuhopecten yessoensis TaxID=6573 RepID=A0A210QKD2_MIZYE|nr:alpha-(1,3)-fucosyltransferase C-like [Mizuhopecten yessoensis]OWF49146.1 Alpha-(1,3)-fucosyltransferase C [Mizuhopecten yessoensis]
MTCLTICCVVAVFFYVVFHVTLHENHGSDAFHSNFVSLQPIIHQNNKLMPTMGAKIPKAPIKPSKASKLRVETSNENIHIKRLPKLHPGFVRTESLPTEGSSMIVKTPGETPIDTCNIGGASQTNTSSVNGTCIRIHYYNPPLWITSKALEHCTYRCYFTSGSNYQSAPAVIFQTSNIVKSPPKKSPGQIWIFHSLEAPGNSKTDFKHWKRLFNWTYTYRRDSDIIEPFAKLHFREIELDIDNYMNSIPLLWQNKSRDAAWFVSRCQVQSNRGIFAKMLSKLVHVDIFGKCGNLKCPSTEWRDCNIMLNKLYKYYLSFENALCVDYVTEKVFNQFVDMSYVLPVIRGRTNLSMYLPPGSYINTNDFKSSSDLASFMTSLVANRTAVDQYFSWWRTFYFTRSGTSGICEICRRLHRARDYRRLYDDVESWYKGSEIDHNMMCKHPRDIK